MLASVFDCSCVRAYICLRLTCSASVIGTCDGPEAFLAGGVPNLELDLLSGDFDDPRPELDADRVGAVSHELFFRELVKKTRFTDAHVTDYNILENIRVVVRTRRHDGECLCVSEGRFFL